MSAYARSRNLKAWREGVGANVRRLRRTANMSQAVLAERAGLSPAYVSMMERGLANPRLETLAALALALNTSPVDILTEAQPEPSRAET
ncbi:helix-turn-helix domain-containing protein [Brevundimonas naejangsanensis]